MPLHFRHFWMLRHLVGNESRCFFRRPTTSFRDIFRWSRTRSWPRVHIVLLCTCRGISIRWDPKKMDALILV